MGRNRRLQGVILWAGLLGMLPLTAQEAGPVIGEFGKVYQVASPDIPDTSDQNFMAVFDVGDSPGQGTGPNALLETAARFLNVHAQNGISPERLQVALVVHGKATEDLLTDEVYRERLGHDNPNSALISALLDAGVQIAVCGQSASARQIPREATIPGVQWALSAMTALVQYQNQGYQLIKF